MKRLFVLFLLMFFCVAVMSGCGEDMHVADMVEDVIGEPVTDGEVKPRGSLEINEAIRIGDQEGLGIPNLFSSIAWYQSLIWNGTDLIAVVANKHVRVRDRYGGNRGARPHPNAGVFYKINPATGVGTSYLGLVSVSGGFTGSGNGIDTFSADTNVVWGANKYWVFYKYSVVTLVDDKTFNVVSTDYHCLVSFVEGLGHLGTPDLRGFLGTEVGSLPVETYFHELVWHNSKLYGLGKHNGVDALYEVNTSTAALTRVGSATNYGVRSPYRFYPTCAFSNGTNIYVLGGDPPLSHHYLWVLNTTDGTVSKVANQTTEPDHGTGDKMVAVAWDGQKAYAIGLYGEFYELRIPD